MSGTLDPERHRPEGMEMAGRVEGVRPFAPDGDVETVRVLLMNEALHPNPADWGGMWREAWQALNRIDQRLRRA